MLLSIHICKHPAAPYIYTAKGRYTVAVKVIDIFGNDTMVLVPVGVG